MSERTVCNRTSSHTNGGSMKGPAGIGGLNPAAQEFVPKQAVPTSDGTAPDRTIRPIRTSRKSRVFSEVVFTPSLGVAEVPLTPHSQRFRNSPSYGANRSQSFSGKQGSAAHPSSPNTVLQGQYTHGYQPLSPGPVLLAHWPPTAWHPGPVSPPPSFYYPPGSSPHSPPYQAGYAPYTNPINILPDTLSQQNTLRQPYHPFPANPGQVQWGQTQPGGGGGGALYDPTGGYSSQEAQMSPQHYPTAPFQDFSWMGIGGSYDGGYGAAYGSISPMSEWPPASSLGSPSTDASWQPPSSSVGGYIGWGPAPIFAPQSPQSPSRSYSPRARGSKGSSPRTPARAYRPSPLNPNLRNGTGVGAGAGAERSAAAERGVAAERSGLGGLGQGRPNPAARSVSPIRGAAAQHPQLAQHAQQGKRAQQGQGQSFLGQAPFQGSLHEHVLQQEKVFSPGMSSQQTPSVYSNPPCSPASRGGSVGDPSCRAESRAVAELALKIYNEAVDFYQEQEHPVQAEELRNLLLLYVAGEPEVVSAQNSRFRRVEIASDKLRLQLQALVRPVPRAAAEELESRGGSKARVPHPVYLMWDGKVEYNSRARRTLTRAIKRLQSEMKAARRL